MTKEQKADFLKRLAQGRATISELTQVSPFDSTVPVLYWNQTELNTYTNSTGEYFENNGIKPGELKLTFTEYKAFMKKAGRYRSLIFSRTLLPGEVDPHADDKRNWITFK